MVAGSEAAGSRNYAYIHLCIPTQHSSGDVDDVLDALQAPWVTGR